MAVVTALFHMDDVLMDKVLRRGRARCMATAVAWGAGVSSNARAVVEPQLGRLYTDYDDAKNALNLSLNQLHLEGASARHLADAAEKATAAARVWHTAQDIIHAQQLGGVASHVRDCAGPLYFVWPSMLSRRDTGTAERAPPRVWRYMSMPFEGLMLCVLAGTLTLQRADVLVAAGDMEGARRAYLAASAMYAMTSEQALLARWGENRNHRGPSPPELHTSALQGMMYLCRGLAATCLPPQRSDGATSMGNPGTLKALARRAVVVVRMYGAALHEFRRYNVAGARDVQDKVDPALLDALAHALCRQRMSAMVALANVLEGERRTGDCIAALRQAKGHIEAMSPEGGGGERRALLEAVNKKLADHTRRNELAVFAQIPATPTEIQALVDSLIDPKEIHVMQKDQLQTPLHAARAAMFPPVPSLDMDN